MEERDKWNSDEYHHKGEQGEPPVQAWRARRHFLKTPAKLRAEAWEGGIAKEQEQYKTGAVLVALTHTAKPAAGAPASALHAWIVVPTAAFWGGALLFFGCTRASLLHRGFL